MTNPQHHATSFDKFSRLSPALRELVMTKGLAKEFSPGEVIVDPLHWDDQIRLIVSGEASLVLR
ncbi:MAG: hypothetical protein ACPL7J_04525, partial [Desulfomonilaceae bacterium]